MKKLIVTLGIASVMVGGVVFAQSGSGARAAVQGSTDQGAGVGAMAHCSTVENNLALRVRTFESTQNNHEEQYLQVRDRVRTLADQLEADGYDVTQLRTHLAEYEAKVDEFTGDHNAYMNQLRETKSYACGRTEGEFRNQLQVARAQMGAVYGDALAVRTYWAETMKADLQELRDQVDADTAADTTTTEEVTDGN